MPKLLAVIEKLDWIGILFSHFTWMKKTYVVKSLKNNIFGMNNIKKSYKEITVHYQHNIQMF